MTNKPVFPTRLHKDAAELVSTYFSHIPYVDTVLVVNSCARGQAVPESDLDFAILVNPETPETVISNIETEWLNYSVGHPTINKYKKSSQFAHLHLDIITGNYTPTILETGVASDYFEIEIGNQICYSATMGNSGPYFNELQNKWLPYYNEEIRTQRLKMTHDACLYDLNHIPLIISRGLHFHAFDILYKAFQEYLQTLFIAHRKYPIAYNKWIKDQVVNWLDEPDLYQKLTHILSILNIESDEINEKAFMLRALLSELHID